MHHEPRSIAPERAELDHNSPPCLCGAMPLLTSSGGQFYMSCPPCWVRTHKVASPEMARLMWSAMLRPEPRRVLRLARSGGGA